MLMKLMLIALIPLSHPCWGSNKLTEVNKQKIKNNMHISNNGCSLCINTNIYMSIYLYGIYTYILAHIKQTIVWQ